MRRNRQRSDPVGRHEQPRCRRPSQLSAQMSRATGHASRRQPYDRAVSWVRRACVERVGDNAVLAEAETDFAFVDARTGRPRRIPADFRAAFAVPHSA